MLLKTLVGTEDAIDAFNDGKIVDPTVVDGAIVLVAVVVGLDDTNDELTGLREGLKVEPDIVAALVGAAVELLLVACPVGFDVIKELTGLRDGLRVELVEVAALLGAAVELLLSPSTSKAYSTGFVPDNATKFFIVKPVWRTFPKA